MTSVLFVFDAFGRGGAQQAFLTLLPLLKETNHNFQIDLVLIQEDENELSIPPEISNVFRLKAKNLLDFVSFIKFHELIRRGHYHTVVANLYWSQIWSALTTYRRKNVVWIEHNTYFTRSEMQWRIFRLLKKRTRRIISVSFDVYRFLQTRGIDSKVIYNPVPTTSRDFEHKARKPHFVFAGRLNEQKNPALALEAFSHFLKNSSACFSDSILWFCGDGPKAVELEATAQMLGLSSQVKLVGSLSQTDLFAKMRECCTLVSTSHYEGFALVRIEAAAQGMCIVSTVTGGLRETLLSKELNQGIFSAKPEAKEIAVLMEKSLEPEYWTLDKVEARRAIASKFDPRQIAKKYIREVLN